jgi:peptidoglycan lytic transglycosylase G
MVGHPRVSGGSNAKRALLIGAAALAVAALAAVYLLWWASGPKPGPHGIIVKEGSTVSSVARQLDQAGAIPGNARTYYVMARLLGSGDPIQAGEFEIPRGMGGAAILDLLQHGKPVQRLITVTEGMPSIIVEEKLAANPYLAGPNPAIAEGSVLPDSYRYERGETRAALAAQMQSAMTKALAGLWAKRSSDCPVATPQQAIILASIVEKETGKAAERPMIAGVYCNRLKIGMKLDADPTVIYPVTKGKPIGRRILKSELAADNGYNTYKRAGLPEGPIANPGKESIAAVLHPAATKALYFVADGSGGHVFAETLAQHQANVERWFALRRARGQM